MISEDLKRKGIYIIKNILNNKCYFGSTTNSFQRRFKAHKSQLNRGIHHSSKLQRAWDKYGESNFIFLIVEICTDEEIIEREQFYIDTFKPFYNECPKAGSCKGVKHRKEVCEAISKRMMGNTY